MTERVYVDTVWEVVYDREGVVYKQGVVVKLM